MEKLQVFGATKLKGTVKISSSKNSSLPILAATLLSKKKDLFKKFTKSKRYRNHVVITRVSWF